MTRAFRRDLLFAVALLVFLGLYAVAGLGWAVQAVLALAALGVVVAHALGTDEVRRAAAFEAGFTAFMLAATLSLGAALLQRADLLASAAEDLWAWLIGLYLLSWIAHRVPRR